MVTLTTKRGKKVQLNTISEWYEWAFAYFPTETLADRQLAGLVALEQAMFQSIHHKVCVNCLSPDNLVLITNRGLVKSTDYYMCQGCLDYYNNK